MTVQGEVLADYAVAPGETLAEWIEEANLSRFEFAALAEVPFDCLKQVLAGTLPLDEGLSEKLAKATGIPVRFWLNAEAHYRESVARLNLGAPD